MFFDEGWVPIGEVTSEVFRRIQEFHAAGVIHDSNKNLKTLLAVSVWDICDASTKIGVTASDGTVISASKNLTDWSDPRAFSNEHMDITVGTVGSSKMPEDDGKIADRETLIARYGPFLSLPIVVPVNNYQSSLTFLEEEVKKNSRDEEVVNSAKTILAMVKAGQMVTRSIAQAKLGATLSRRKFKLAWALAAGHHEELAQPNRWLGL